MVLLLGSEARSWCGWQGHGSLHSLVLVSVAHPSFTMHLVTSESETPENLAAGS